jgi:two-component system KDP operon response regulator KdpE
MTGKVFRDQAKKPAMGQAHPMRTNREFDLGFDAKVLVACDDQENMRVWTYILRDKGIGVLLATTLDEAMRLWAEQIPDLIVIDMYSEQEGIELSIRLRDETIAPILFFCAQNDEALFLEAYQAGADECAMKPIRPPLLWSKVKAWLRRSWTVPVEGLDILQSGDLKLDPSHRRVTLADATSIRLTALEFRVLNLLMSHPGWVMKTEDIVMRVWGYYGNGDSNLLKNVIYRLRRKIEPDPKNPRFIHTEVGLGYRFYPN